MWQQAKEDTKESIWEWGGGVYICSASAAELGRGESEVLGQRKSHGKTM